MSSGAGPATVTLLFGVAGLGAEALGEAEAVALACMKQRAEVTLGAGPGGVVESTIAAGGVEFCACQRKFAGEAPAPPMAQTRQLLLAMRGQLDARSELQQRLGLPTRPHAPGTGDPGDEPTDAALVLAAYQRFGPDCVEHLLGDWVFALWDASRNRLLLARDASGTSALFWRQAGRHLYFASSLPTLLAGEMAPVRPDLRWLAGLLTVFTDPARPGATAFEDVHAVPPGHLLLVQDGQVNLKRWWKPEALDRFDGVPWAELQSEFLALYQDAVRERLRRPGGAVAATLSGGLDSGSVVALAAPLLALQGQQLTAYVHTPRFDPGSENADRTADEWPLALATARHVGNVQAVPCASAQFSPVGGIHHWLDRFELPGHAASNWFWLLDIAAAASAGGARVLLTGQGGNATVSYNGTGNLWPRLAQWRLMHVARQLAGEQSGWLSGLRDRLVKPALRPAWYGMKQAWAGRGPDPAWIGFSLLRPSQARQLGLADAMRAARHDPGLGAYAPERMARFRLGFHGGADSGTAATAELGLAHGLEIRDPTRDRRLVEYCWRLPDEIYWAAGRQRGLIRSGMCDHLPPEVLFCARKGLQSADLRARLLASRAELLDAVSTVSRHALVREWFDTDRLMLSARAALAEPGAPVPGSVGLTQLLRALAAAMFVVRRG